MLRMLYLACLWKAHGGSWRVLCCPCVKALSADYCPEETKGSWTARGLKRRLIKRAVTPALALSSVVADVDVATDWYFWRSDEIQESATAGVAAAALFFALLGTFSWLLLATDCLGWLRVSSSRRACYYYCRHRCRRRCCCCCCSSPSSSSPSSSCWDVFRYLPVINTVMEDFPQLVITFLTTGFHTVAGALNITAAVFGFLAKVAEAYATEGDDLPTEFAGVADDTTRPLVEERFNLDDRTAAEKNALKETSELIVAANRRPDRESSMLNVFKVARDQGAFVRYAVNVRVVRLNSADLRGPIPPKLGTLPSLTELSLVSCGLTGSIPAEIGNLVNLTVLRLDWNNLTGPIPPELSRLTGLQELDLYHNSLTGTVPLELSQLTRLRVLNLHGNDLTGEVPPQLSHILARPADGFGINNHRTTTTYGTGPSTPHHDAREAVPAAGQLSERQRLLLAASLNDPDYLPHIGLTTDPDITI